MITSLPIITSRTPTGDTQTHTLFSYYALQTAHVKLMILLCLIKSARLAHLWTLEMEGVTFKKSVFKGSRKGRAEQQPGEQNAKSSAVISTLVTPSLHSTSLSCNNRELSYPCLLEDMKRKACNHDAWRLNLAVKSMEKGEVRIRRPEPCFPPIGTLWPQRRRRFHFFITKWP